MTMTLEEHEALEAKLTQMEAQMSDENRCKEIKELLEYVIKKMNRAREFGINTEFSVPLGGGLLSEDDEYELKIRFIKQTEIKPE